MPDLRWDEVKPFFDPELMGSLPDGCVPGTAVEDWQALLDLIRTSGWRWELTRGGTPVPGPLPTAEELLARQDGEVLGLLAVWPTPGVRVNFWPFSAEDVDYDFDLRELQGQAGVDAVCGFLAAVGRRLGKRAGMGGEGSGGHPVLAYDPEVDRVVLPEDSPGFR
ncbi:hypothetical protein [Saccharothrix syringae]|uniref:Uncharacterized protein n=1 Tax=Saccharothrix syringae TaxID=103733 RepID=A0A5Q0GTV6_SACSY|nr:hypothetical protein [Saccharothrix syringae]QFZ17055.1 hypothetical protein EKG83_05840 [Saccharothrix syringae]